MVKLSTSSPCRSRAEYALAVNVGREVKVAYEVDAAVGKGGEAGSVGNGVQSSLDERSSAGDNSGSEGGNALCSSG